MKLTPFGEAARHLRMRYDLSLMKMAQGMGISPAYLSSIEYGEKRLSEKHIDAALAFLGDFAAPAELRTLRHAAERSQEILNMQHLDADTRGLVAAFARKVSEGTRPPAQLLRWLKDNGAGD